MTIPPVDSLSHWISPREQYRWLKSPYQADLESVFPCSLAKIISHYIDYNLGSNRTNWYKALIELRVVPDKIPPLPLNIHEILNRDCPIHRDAPNQDGTYKKIKDTHFLCLIPAERIDTLAERKFGVAHAQPYLSTFHSAPSRCAHLHDPDMTSFNEPEWVLIPNVLLPGSENMNYADQVGLFENWKATTDINYEIPSFKHTLAANLLYAAAEKRGLWGKSLCSRVRETYYWKSSTIKEWWIAPLSFDKRNLTIADPYSGDNLETGVDEAPCAYISHQLGMTVLWKITKPTPKPLGSCSVS